MSSLCKAVEYGQDGYCLKFELHTGNGPRTATTISSVLEYGVLPFDLVNHLVQDELIGEG